MLLQQFQQNLKHNFSQLSTGNCEIILAVSGGIDSVVMTDLFYRLNFDFIIAHCNFQLRAAESERDELFVQELGKQYKKEVLIKRFDTKSFAENNKISIQEAARILRYDWFNETRSLQFENQNLNTGIPKYIATAHNADDNIETMLMFLFRGTGIHGLTGVNAFDKERKIIRPLLFALRKNIQAYALENNIKWVEDSSNAVDKYTRNFFRLNIIPAIEAHYPNAKQNLLESINRFKAAEVLYHQSIGLHKKKLLEFKGNEIHIPVLKIKKTKPLTTVLWEIIKPYNFNTKQVDEIKKLFDADNSSYVQSSTHRIIKNRNWLIIAPHNSESSEFVLIEENSNQAQFKNGVLNFERLSAFSLQLSAIQSVAQLDMSQIVFPLLLRKWKQGDYFYPLGMYKKKKLSRFFIDQKLSATAKENIWVLEMNKKIIWIIGYRIDERFKITSSTKEVLKISFTPA